MKKILSALMVAKLPEQGMESMDPISVSTQPPISLRNIKPDIEGKLFMFILSQEMHNMISNFDDEVTRQSRINKKQHNIQ